MKTRRREPNPAVPSERGTAARKVVGTPAGMPSHPDRPPPIEPGHAQAKRLATAHPPSRQPLREEQRSLHAVLLAGLSQLHIESSEKQRGQLLAHLALIQHWGRVYNLTAIRDAREMLVHHLLDSLSIVPALQRYLATRPNRAARPRLLDVGSGAGLPGTAIAIMLPGVEVCCVDSVAKKASFIKQVSAELGLANLRAVHARVQALVESPFDVITSRAFASLQDFVAWTQPLLAPGGVWMAMKGRIPAELGALMAGVEAFHVEPLVVPGLEAERCLVWLRRASSPSAAEPPGITSRA